MDLLAIPLLAAFFALVFLLNRDPDHNEERIRVAGKDDEEIDFDDALRSIGGPPR